MLQAAKDWLTVIAMVIAIASPLAVLWLRSQFATKDELEKLKAANETRDDDLDKKFAPKDVGIELGAIRIRIDNVEDRIARVEGEIKHLPDKEVTHRMEVALERLRGEVNAMNERLEPVARTSERLQEFLLEQAGRR